MASNPSIICLQCNNDTWHQEMTKCDIEYNDTPVSLNLMLLICDRCSQSCATPQMLDMMINEAKREVNRLREKKI